MDFIGVKTLLTMKGGIIAKGIESNLEKMAADIAVAPDVKDWRALQLIVRSRPHPETGATITEVILKPVKLSERVTSFVGDVRQDQGRHYHLVADLEALGLSEEDFEEVENHAG